MEKKKIKIIDIKDVPPMPSSAATDHCVMYGKGTIESRRLVTRKKDGSERMSFHVNKTKGECKFESVVYPDMDEINYLVEGEGIITFDGKSQKLHAGMIYWIPAGAKYDMVFTSDTAVHISVFSPPRE